VGVADVCVCVCVCVWMGVCLLRNKNIYSMNYSTTEYSLYFGPLMRVKDKAVMSNLWKNHSFESNLFNESVSIQLKKKIHLKKKKGTNCSWIIQFSSSTN